MRTFKKRASILLVGVVLMAGCWEEDDPFAFTEGESRDGRHDPGHEGDEDCDPYFGDCEDEGPFDAGTPLDAGWIDTGCEEDGGPPPPPPPPDEPPCDPYDGECTPEPEPEPDPEPDPEPEPDTGCDPYTGTCEPEPDADTDPGDPPEDCDPYIDDCSPPVN